MDNSLLFENTAERKVKKTLGERFNAYSLLHFNVAQTAIFGAYIWMRGSNDAFSLEAFALATGAIVCGWVAQLVLMLTHHSD